MVEADLIALFSRWLDGRAVPGEEDLLRARFSALSPEDQHQLLQADWERFTETNDPYFTENQLEFMLANIFSEERADQEIKVFPINRKPWWRTAAAAAVAGLLIAIGGYLIYRNSGKQTEIANIKTDSAIHDALPGGNKAMLTLSNGSTIILDSAHLGQIAAQANVYIIKSDSGKLVYNILKEKPTALLYNTLTTPRGGQYQLALPDGTKVWLNAASSIKYPVAFIGKERMVEITGEAYFEVRHNAAMPFKVKAGAQLIEDIGTAFNVNAYADEGSIKTTLLEGAVKVSIANGQWSMLKPGEQAIINTSAAFNIQHSTFNIDRSSDLELVMAWKNGLFSFKGADLQTVMRQLSRWYDVDVTYEGKIPERRFSGDIRRMLTLDQVLKMLTQTRVHYTIENKKLTIRN